MVRTNGRTVTWLPNFLGWVDYQISLAMGLRPRARFARGWGSAMKKWAHCYGLRSIITISACISSSIPQGSFRYSGCTFHYLLHARVLWYANQANQLKNGMKCARASADCVPLRCFDTVFQRPYRYFSVALKVFFSLSDRYETFTSTWQWIEICGNVVLSKIDITMTRSNRSLGECVRYVCWGGRVFAM